MLPRKPPSPFVPGKRLTRPELFAGRLPQLVEAVSLLERATVGNARHALITGEVGIGKSSLASQVEGIAKGEDRFRPLVDRDFGDFHPQFIVATHIAQMDESLEDIVAGLLHSLNRARGKKGYKVKWEFSLDLKIARGTVERAESPRDATREFVDALESVWHQVQGAASGILVIIDEVDRVASTEGVGTFLKVATEMLTARGIENAMILLVGVVGAERLIAEEHQSVDRIFDVIHVPLLTQDESLEVVARALNGSGVRITDEANHELARLAAGFPHPIHLLGAAAYDADTDWIIDEDDVATAITLVVTAKWRTKFEQRFVEAGSGRVREILREMANYPEEDVPLAHLCTVLDVKQQAISSTLGNLMEREVIVRVDRGVYRFRDALFRVYVRAMREMGNEPVQKRPRKRSERRPGDRQARGATEQ